MLGDSLLAGRYRLRCEMNRGAQGATWLAADEKTQRRVTLRQISATAIGNWKSVDLIQREAAVLKRLSHPGIAAYLDDFVIEEPPDAGYYLVKEHVRGSTLEHLLAAPDPVPLAESLRIVRELLLILRYLHEVEPPVIHRDIKPSNIIVGPDGRVVLIDFGILQEGLVAGGSTVAGTGGYMAPEQAMGRAVPQSDLFAVGTTLVHLLSRTHPAKLALNRGRLDFADRTSAPAEVVAFASRLTSPNLEDRPFSARDALAELERLAPAPAAASPSAASAPAPASEALVAAPAPLLPPSTRGIAGLVREQARTRLGMTALAAGLSASFATGMVEPDVRIARAQVERMLSGERAQMTAAIRTELTAVARSCESSGAVVPVEILAIWRPQMGVTCRVLEAPPSVDTSCVEQQMEARLLDVRAPADLTTMTVGVLP